MINTGKLLAKEDGLFPCTPQGCLRLIKEVYKDLSGLNAAVIGRSSIVGRPMAELLLQNNCTVTIMHEESKNLKGITSKADILVSATGVKHLVKEDWVKKGAVVIDVGISRVQDESGEVKIVGDVDFENVIQKVRAITPVPGGVGPMTICYLMKNVAKAMKMGLKI